MVGRVKQGNYHAHVLYTKPNPNYTLPKPYPFITTYPIHRPTLDTQTVRVWIPRLWECYSVQVSTLPYPGYLPILILP